MTDAIRQIIEAGGTVVFPFNEVRRAWVKETKVYGHTASDRNDTMPSYWVECEEFKDPARAAEAFVERTITRANIGLAQAYWLARGIDFDDLDGDEVDSLTASFVEDIFPRLYPFAAEKT